MKPGRSANRKHRDRAALARLFGITATLLALAGAYLWAIGAHDPRSAGSTAIGGAFTLTGGAGQPVTDRDFKGKYLLIYFGYTHCRDICPTTLASLGTALESIGEKADRIQPVFISIDPIRDTPAEVQDYVRTFTPRLVGLTGSNEAIRRLADAYHLSVVSHQADANDRDYTVDHSSVIYVVGPDGRYIAPIEADLSSAALAKAIAGYVS